MILSVIIISADIVVINMKITPVTTSDMYCQCGKQCQQCRHGRESYHMFRLYHE